MNIEPEQQPMTLAGTESRRYFTEEWHPGGVTIEVPVHEVRVSGEGRFADVAIFRHVFNVEGK
jgi:hypothetical protein